MAKKTTVKKAAAKRNISTAKVSKQVSVFARTTNKSQQWVREIQKDLKWVNADGVYQLLRAVLQALRDQMNVHEAAHFAAQLPLLLKGSFYEGWNPQLTRGKGATKEDFLESIKSKMSPVGDVKFDFESGVLAALHVIKKHISAGEMNDIAGLVNPSLKVFIEKENSQKETTI